MDDKGFKHKFTTIISAVIFGYGRLMEGSEEAAIHTLNA
jgi:hypothetical protein